MQGRLGANIVRSTVERRHYGKNKPPVSKFLKDGVSGKKSFFLKKFSSPPKKHKIHNSAFSLAREAQRKSLAKRKRRFMGSAQTRKFFEKNLTKNFQLGCGANTSFSTAERIYNAKNKTLFFKVLER